MRLDLPPMQTTPKVEQVKAYFSAVENPHNPFHNAVKDTQGCRLGRNKIWIDQAEVSILQACQLTEPKQTNEREKHPNRFRRLYETLPLENLGKHCQEWRAGKTESESKRSVLSLKKTANLKTSLTGMCQWLTSAFENSCGCTVLDMPECTLRAPLSGTFLQTLPDLVTPLKGHSLSPRSCPPTRSAPSERFGY